MGEISIYYQTFRDFLRIKPDEMRKLCEGSTPSSNLMKHPKHARKHSYVTKALLSKPLKRKFVSREEFLAMQNLLFTLQTLSQKLVSELDVESILNEIMKTLGQALGAVWVNIWELTPDKKAAYIRQGYGRKGTEVYIEHSRKKPLKLGTAFLGRAIKTKKTWSSSDMWTDPHLPRSWIKRVKEQNFRGIVCAPQMVESAKVIGGMCVYFDRVRNLSDFEMRLVTIAANEAAVAIVNAGIYKELLAERDKTLAIIDSLNEGVILFDNDWKVLMINPKAQEILFIQDKEAVGKVLTKDFSQISIFHKNLYTIGNLSLGDFEKREHIIERPQRITLEITEVPVTNLNKRKIGSMRILRDITREKEIGQLESKFITTASHQLRTPLSSIRWALDAVRSGEKGQLNREQKEIIEKTYTATTNLAGLLEDLLNISKIEEGKFIYSFKKRDLLPFVKKILKDMSIQLQERKTNLVFKEPDTALPQVSADTDILSMALRNILDNAIRYSLEGGDITVSLFPADRNVIFSVRDKGIGIPEEDKKFIFSKFFRAKNAQLFQTEGSGLGLYLAKNIVEKHNGRIIFESVENKGSEFFIYLPSDPNKMPEVGEQQLK